MPEIIEDRLGLPLGEAHVVIPYPPGEISYLPGEQSETEQAETASDEAVCEVHDALADVEPDTEPAALLDEPPRHAGQARVAGSISERVFPLLTQDERDRRPRAGRGRLRRLRLAAGQARPARIIRTGAHARRDVPADRRGVRAPAGRRPGTVPRLVPPQVRGARAPTGELTAQRNPLTRNESEVAE
ncbi:hypothetical protein [Lentzea sp.]|uniref:hypothetical protein n=1 Tax=Lentzea sp. TaxID=56099 RepID=UPI002C334C93|nr:hypothetical protein [Lentzea sp.]HUQ57321.1 hypothetical protein [Lentzea sp.]